ncbi:hypothetical protein ACM614_01080 [Streptomyces sp. 12297]|uniref:hypothetical protein n=1 Tax=Streptomyces sp. NBC_00239 TaxID=2903640 RepID=UPI002E2818FB|nr:hypothetical protein [Streptomyces sp. NBC_00239]
MALFSVRYRGSVPTLVLTGGTIVPSLITVVDGSGTILAEYRHAPPRSGHQPDQVGPPDRG